MLLMARFMALLLILLGAGVLAGWWLDIPAWRTVLPGLASMHANTAASFMLCGVALFCRADAGSAAQRLRRQLGRLVAVIALLTLSQDLHGRDLGLDRWLFDFHRIPGEVSGRMSPATALCFALNGWALASRAPQAHARLARWAAVIAGSTALLAVFGHLFDEASLYHLSPYASMALHTALGLVLLCAGILAAGRNEEPRTRPLGVAAGMALMALLAAGWVSADKLAALAELDRSETHTRLVQLKLEQFSAALHEAESSQRGYVLTGDARHLDAYTSAVRQTRAHLSALGELTSNTTGRQAVLETLESTFELKLAGMDDTVELHRTRGFDAARANVERVWTQGYMATIRSLLDKAMAEEQRDLDLYGAAKAADAARTVHALVVGGVLATFTLLASLVLLQRQVVRRQRSEAALQAQRDRLEDMVQARTADLAQTQGQQRLFIEHMPVAMAMFDRDMHYLDTSRRWLHDYGLEGEVLVGRSHYALFPDTPAHWKTVHQRALAGGVVTAEADRYVRADGSVQWLRWEARPWYDQHGEVGGIVIFTEDITHRRMQDQALRENEQRFRGFFDNMAVGAVQLDAQGRFVQVNDRYCAITGYRRDELLGTSPLSINHPEEQEADMERLKRFLSGEGVYESEKRIVCKDGRIAWIHVVATAVRDGSGTTRFTTGVVQDVTARHEAEAALQASARQLERYNADLEQVVAQRTRELERAHDQFRDFVLRAPIAMCFVETQGRIALRNEQFLAALGYDENQVPDLAAWWPRAYPAEADRAAAVAQWQKIGSACAPNAPAYAPHEYAITCADGTVRLMEVAGVMLERGFLATFVDVTRRKAAEAELVVRRQEAEAASRAKSEFLVNMSHEIRTPMNAVLGLAYLLEKQHLPEDAAGMVRKIRSAGRLLLGIINDILDYSKIEAGRLEFERAPFQLDDVLDNLSVVMSATASEKDLELAIQPPPGPMRLYGDALRLEQVLINLTSNAIKFTERGQVEVSIRVENKDESQATLRFAVRDTGIGITAAQLQAIFAPFSQADASTTRRFGGTGLGLAISRRLVSFMGGELQVRSSESQGSEFWFSLRFDRAASLDQFSAPGLEALDVVIADDSAIAREAMQLTATQLGWNATIVPSGRGALEVVEGRRKRQAAVDLVLLDWQMPDMDGLATARAIRAAQPRLKPGLGKPIIMVTAYAREGLLAQPDIALVDEVLSKPVTASALYNAVARVLQRRSGFAAKSAQTQSQRLKGLHLLVVDDSDINREVAQRIFNHEGARVSVAINGRQALDWLREHGAAVDLVLMDVQMPVMDGYEATREIRRVPALSTLPVVALTGGAFKSQQEAARDAGMNDFIAKPFDVEAAVALIRRLTGAVAFDSRVECEPDATSDEEFAGIDLRAGLRLWKTASDYRRNLRRFAAEYCNGAWTQTAPSRTALAALAHKLRGVAGNLGLAQVAAAARDVELALNERAETAGAEAALTAALATAQQSILRYAPVVEPDLSPARTPALARDADAARLTALLSRLIDIWDSFNPEEIEQLLAQLNGLLAPEALQLLRTANADYAYRRGKTATRALAAALDLPLNPKD